MGWVLGFGDYLLSEKCVFSRIQREWNVSAMNEVAGE